MNKTYDSGRTIWAAGLTRSDVGKSIVVDGHTFLLRSVQRGGQNEPVFVDVVTQIRLDPRAEVVVRDA